MRTYNILVIDDDPSIRKLLGDLLADRPRYRPLMAASGKEALKCMTEYRVDVVLSDIHMPGFTGLDLLKDMQKVGMRPEIVVMTANATPENVEAARGVGARSMLVKPFDDLGAVESEIEKAVDDIEAAGNGPGRKPGAPTVPVTAPPATAAAAPSPSLAPPSPAPKAPPQAASPPPPPVSKAASLPINSAAVPEAPGGMEVEIDDTPEEVEEPEIQEEPRRRTAPAPGSRPKPRMEPVVEEEPDVEIVEESPAPQGPGQAVFRWPDSIPLSGSAEPPAARAGGKETSGGTDRRAEAKRGGGAAQPDLPDFDAWRTGVPSAAVPPVVPAPAAVPAAVAVPRAAPVPAERAWPAAKEIRSAPGGATVTPRDLLMLPGPPVDDTAVSPGRLFDEPEKPAPAGPRADEVPKPPPIKVAMPEEAPRKRIVKAAPEAGQTTTQPDNAPEDTSWQEPPPEIKEWAEPVPAAGSVEDDPIEITDWADPEPQIIEDPETPPPPETRRRQPAPPARAAAPQDAAAPRAAAGAARAGAVDRTAVAPPKPEATADIPEELAEILRMDEIFDLEKLKIEVPIVFLQTWEEEAAVASLRAMCESMKKELYRWSAASGLARDSGASMGDAYRDPHRALEFIRRQKRRALYVLADFRHYLEDPAIVRVLREMVMGRETVLATLVLTSPRFTVPPELARVAAVFEWPAFEGESLRTMFEEIRREVEASTGKRIALAPEKIEALLGVMVEMPSARARFEITRALMTLMNRG